MDYARRTYHDPEKHDRVVGHSKNWQKNNPEKYMASARGWRERNLDRAREINRAWRANNPAAVRAIHSRRKARKLRVSQNSYTGNDVVEIIAKQKGKCAYCGTKLRSDYHVDHIMPLALGGDNSRRNIQITCPDCNIKKHALHPVSFAQKIGLLC